MQNNLKLLEYVRQIGINKTEIISRLKRFG